MKIGDKIKCVSRYDPHEDTMSAFLIVGQEYVVKDIQHKNGLDYVLIEIDHHDFLYYHPAHFDIKYQRKEKLKKLKKCGKI